MSAHEADTMEEFLEQLQTNNSDTKKFRKTRDYFGKRKYNAVAAGETGKLGFDEDSNDSGVSTREMMMVAVKCEPNSPSTASVTSGVSSTASPSSTSSLSNVPLKQRVKIIRLGNNTSLQSILQGSPKGSSTQVVFPTAKPLRARQSSTGSGCNTPKGKKAPRNEGSKLDEIKRNKWELDLERVMKLIQNIPMIKEVKQGGKKMIKEEVKENNCAAVRNVVVTSSKRRIIPKQRISV